MACMLISALAHRSTMALLIGMACAGVASAQEVWFITDAQHLPQGTHQPARRIELDAPQRIEAELAANLPTDPQQAAQVIRQRLQAGGVRLQQRMQTAYQGVVDAWSLGIATIPAVIVDRRYVIYGETNIDRAVSRIAQYRRASP